ncbi:endonuclease I family protein [Sulfidibacter corallicola]|uniref:Endonuclease n=1 Tax=Sulfidibacter corallicola TaxID=2818388 RepID=A0A8A4TG31_SULCO|nr:endonuclease [Sulfidibacter corallicola]QTD48487.1 endonuclease [Sulfidibacter corallicola]
MAQRINEFNANHTGQDTFEYIEIFGTPETDFSNLTVLQIEGDVGDDTGTILSVHPVGTTDASGYWWTGFLSEVVQNGSMALYLVEGFSGQAGNDLDTNDDGTLDVAPWTSIVDQVGVDDGSGDPRYASLTLEQNYDGISFTVGGASFLPADKPLGTDADWIRNDFHGAGLPNLPGTLDSNEAVNTPGAPNSQSPPPPSAPIITEFLLDHTGQDTAEFIEIFGEREADYSETWLLILDGDGSANPGEVLVAMQAGTTNNVGFYATGAVSDAFPDGTATIYAVANFNGSVGMDLDSDDNGTIDQMRWDVVYDSVAVSHERHGDLVYSDTVLTLTLRRGANAPGGASRWPYYRDTDSAADWFRNDFDGEGLDGFSGSVEVGEAYNTPARVNRVGRTDYYNSVNPDAAQAAFRTALHDAIDDHVYHPYSDDQTDTWDILELADENPGNGDSVITIYKNASYTKFGGGNGPYNREHTWPKSYGFPDNTFHNSAYTDCHHLRISDGPTNSTRSNTPYGNCDAGCNELPTDANNGVGGGTGQYPGNSNWYDNGQDIFEVWFHRRGDIARSILYMDVRYEGGSHAPTEMSEPDLILTDNLGLIQTTGSNVDTGYMGRLSVLLEWHEADPVDDEERRRNEIVYQFQGNRNPFVDFPEWVDCIFNGECGGVEIPACIRELFPSWQAGSASCGDTSVYSVLTYTALLNGDCSCAP